MGWFFMSSPLEIVIPNRPLLLSTPPPLSFALCASPHHPLRMFSHSLNMGVGLRTGGLHTLCHNCRFVAVSSRHHLPCTAHIVNRPPRHHRRSRLRPARSRLATARSLLGTLPTPRSRSSRRSFASTALMRGSCSVARGAIPGSMLVAAATLKDQLHLRAGGDATFASQSIMTASPAAYFAVRAGGGFWMFEPSETAVTTPWHHRSSEPP